MNAPKHRSLTLTIRKAVSPKATYTREMQLKSVYLIIVDGFGVSEENSRQKRNAIKEAETPNIDRLWSNNPSGRLKCHGEYVGMPNGIAGNSEVGHLTIGSGERVEQPYRKINRLFAEGIFEGRISPFLHNLDKVHFIGLCSDGGVHSDINHLESLCEIALNNNVQPIVHFIADGRDVSPMSANKFAERITEMGVPISSVAGRHYAMDRDRNMDRTRETLNAFKGKSENTYKEPEEAINSAHHNDITDQYIQPSNIEGVSDINDNSSVFMFNFRDDRMIQLYELVEKEVSSVLTMTNYKDSNFSNHIIDYEVADTSLAEILDSEGYTQYRIAESEKKPHVTWFFDGQKDL